MSGSRIDLLQIETRLKALLPSTWAVATRGSANLKASFGLEFPAAYILKQNSQSISMAAGGSGAIHYQTFHWYCDIAIVGRKYDDAEDDTEGSYQEDYELVAGKLVGWKIPIGGWTAIDIASLSDGGPADPIYYGVPRIHWGTIEGGVGP